MKKWLRDAPPLAQFVEVLPQDVELFPQDLLRNAYPDGFTPCHPSLTWTAHVIQQASTFPLKKTNQVACIASACAVRRQGTAELSAGVLDVLVGALSSRQSAEQQAGQQAGHVNLQPQEKPKATQLALENGPVPPASQQATDVAQVPACGAGTSAQKQLEPKAKEPAAMIASLRAGLDGEKHAEAPEKKEKGTRKQKFKRPCAAPKAAAKAKAKAKAKASKFKTGKSLDMAEKGASLFRKVPKHLQDLYRGGCSTCRKRPWRTLSCWAKRGFYPDA